jgi:hypothetical protein
MVKILLGLIGLGFVAYVAIRMLPPSNSDGTPIATAESSETAKQSAGSSTGPGSSRFQQLMAKATGENGGAGRDGEGLRQFVARVDPNRLTFRELDELFESLSTDPETGLLLMDRVLEDPDRRWKPIEKENLLRRAGSLAAIADFGGLSSRLDEMEGFDDRSLFVQGAAEGLAGQEIEKSLMWIESLGETALQGPALHGVGKAWGKQDLEVAKEWAEGLDDPDGKAQALKGLVAGWALEDSESAFEYAQNAPEELIDGLIVEAAGSIALTNPQEASQQVVMAVSDPKQKAVLEESVAGWAEDDFEGAAAWSMLVSNSDLRDTAMISLADHWSKDDPKKATEWAESFPTADAKARMLEKTVPQWVQTNPTEAAEWFQGRPVDLPQINLLRKTIETIGADDPGAAQDWLNQLNQPALEQIGKGFIQALP